MTRYFIRSYLIIDPCVTLNFDLTSSKLCNLFHLIFSFDSEMLPRLNLIFFLANIQSWISWINPLEFTRNIKYTLTILTMHQSMKHFTEHSLKLIFLWICMDVIVRKQNATSLKNTSHAYNTNMLHLHIHCEFGDIFTMWKWLDWHWNDLKIGYSTKISFAVHHSECISLDWSTLKKNWNYAMHKKRIKNFMFFLNINLSIKLSCSIYLMCFVWRCLGILVNWTVYFMCKAQSERCAQKGFYECQHEMLLLSAAGK